MAEEKEARKELELEVSVNLKDFEENELKLAAYVFNHSGRLVAKEPIKVKEGRGVVELKIKETPQRLLVKVGPDVEDLKDLSRKQPISRMAIATPGKKTVIDIDILKLSWICWLQVPYLVTGTVKKGSDPICSGEVDIYEVDFRSCFWRLPDLVIERIRDAIIDVVIDPPPIELPEILAWPQWDDDDWCGTGPKPPFPSRKVLSDEDIIRKLEKLPDQSMVAKQRFIELPNAKANIGAELQKMSLYDRRAFLDREAVEGVKIDKLLHTTTKHFRELLIEKFLAFRFWLCWPWIYWIWWPWCYSWEKIGIAELQPDGSFSKIIWLSVCNKDTPDLWFVVRQEINGVEKVIYERHPIPCHTYWNHPSGDPVHLVVTDPDAIACFGTPPTDKPGLYVMPLGIGWDGWYDVQQAHIKPLELIDPNRGLYNGTDPYGTDLNIQMQFHDGLRGIGVMYYRWSYKREGTTDWVQIDKPIVHRYLTIIGGKPFIKSKSLGPNSLGSEGNLFEIPDPALDWILINRLDRRFAAWDTSSLTNEKYELKLEMFDNAGNNITDPITKGFKYFLPLSGPVGDVWPVDDNPHIETDGSIILHVHIDNHDTVAQINSVGLGGGTFTGECQFLEYTDPVTDDVVTNYFAYHPKNFLSSYNLTIKRGKSGSNVASHSSITPASPPLGETKKFNVQDLLGSYPQCTFGIELHTYPRTRDGYSRIRAYEDHATATFALVPASP
ncbi:MAG: hypothetical protein JJV98_12790 [Desulfosarcina sp.]|nr:hypothetical protein [Desulfobacterales bacterium]